MRNFSQSLIDNFLRCFFDLNVVIFQTLSIVENDLSLRIWILKLLQIYSSKSRNNTFCFSWTKFRFFEFLAECVARMLTYDCVNRLVSRMNDSDASGEWVFNKRQKTDSSSNQSDRNHLKSSDFTDEGFALFSSFLIDRCSILFRLLFRTIELLWNLLEHGDSQQISDQLNSRVTISLLQEAFFGQVTQSHSQYHRQLRFDKRFS